jgi:hypothetical protein
MPRKREELGEMKRESEGEKGEVGKTNQTNRSIRKHPS